jgi:hypothetical protein
MITKWLATFKLAVLPIAEAHSVGYHAHVARRAVPVAVAGTPLR